MKEISIIPGTFFQKKVWQELLKIPKGQTRSYKEIANAIGNPKAARAVANACGKNPYPIKIPCHRAIRSDGSIAESLCQPIHLPVGLLPQPQSIFHLLIECNFF